MLDITKCERQVDEVDPGHRLPVSLSILRLWT
jgi:hypothetical protein